MVKNDNLALISAIVLIVALLTAVVVLLVAHIITLDQVGPFLIALVVPLTAIASLPIFKAALSAPSPEQSQQLQMLHVQSVQALANIARAAQPIGDSSKVPIDSPGVLNAAIGPSVAPVQPVPQSPFPEPIPQMTVPLAAIQRQSGQ